MKLFDKKGICSICGSKKGTDRFVTDGYVCPDCIGKCGYFLSIVSNGDIRNNTVMQVKQAIRLSENNLNQFNEFVTTKRIEDYILFDETHKWFMIGTAEKSVGNIVYPIIHEYKDIIGFELLEDGESLTNGGMANAIAGGVLFGETGAFVGGATGTRRTKRIISSMKIKITLNDLANPAEYIRLIETDTAMDSATYRLASLNAQNILSVLSVILEKTKSFQPQNIGAEAKDIPGELREYKSLLDDGIISEDEFNAKKKQLLGL